MIDFTKYNVAARRRRTMKRIASGKPLPMFAEHGGGYSNADFVWHIKIGNALHVLDLKREAMTARTE
jgi:hypothetical protein